MLDCLIVLAACLLSTLLGAWIYHRAQRQESPMPAVIRKQHKARPPKRDEDIEDTG
jgi:hypothetical protein